MNRKNLICIFLVSAIWLGLFAPFVATPSLAQINLPSTASQTAPEGLQFRIRESAAPAVAAVNLEVPKNASTQNLSESESKAILRRLPALKIEPAAKSDFALRSNTLLPPKTGNIIANKFPADEPQKPLNVANRNPAALEVIRFSPAGDVSLASDLSVTFSQPMTTVASQSQTGQNVPIQLNPNVRGRWRWLGTKTIVFDAETRFPMATKFIATVPAGTKSAVGGILPKEISWTFSTPPPKVESFSPAGETVKPDALFLASFDQAINAEAVLSKTIAVTANNQQIPLRLATQSEIDSNSNISNEIKQLQPRRWIAFKAIGLLPPDSPITTTFESGLPSAEGDLTTTMLQSYSFKTFGALKLNKSYCSYEVNHECEPSEEWRIEFNNRLDGRFFDKAQIKIEPDIKNSKIEIYGNQIVIEGDKIGSTSYEVTFAGTLRDEFGQTLGKDVSTNFKVGTAPPVLFAQGENLVTLDPHGKPSFSVYSVNQPNLKVRLYAVTPDDWQTFREAVQTRNQEEKNRTRLPGKIAFDQLVPVNGKPDELTETRIDLSPALSNNFGQLIVSVEATNVREQKDYYGNRKTEEVMVWLQVTQIGLDAFADNENLAALVTDLKTGKPLSNTEAFILNGASAKTDESGFINLTLPEKESKSGLLVAKLGDDMAILPEMTDFNYSNRRSNWYKISNHSYLRDFVFNDRNMYRPGETVSVKGYLREFTGGKFGDIAGLGQLVTKNEDNKITDKSGLSYVVKDSENNEILKGQTRLNAFGTFDLTFKLPDNMNLGRAEVEFESDLRSHEFTHNFQVQEFRRPEFEVSATVETAAPFYLGDSATIAVAAKYYSGGALSNAETHWKVTASQTNYTPPNRDDFTFGRFVRWWNADYESNYGGTTSKELKGATDANGNYRIAVDLVSANPARPFILRADASVQDVNRQTFAAGTSLLVHPAELYIGIRTKKTFVSANEFFKVETITTDLDGKTVAGAPVLINAELKDWQQIKGDWQEVVVDRQTCRIKSGDDVVLCDFTAKAGGVYTITASVFDSRERRNESELTMWVAGGTTEPKRDVKQEAAELIPDKKDYAPGDTAEILVNSPFIPAEGVLTLRRNGIVKTERFTMNEASTVLHVTLEERYLPNIHIQVDLVGASPRTAYDDERDAKLPKRPAFASGELNLKISTASRKLSVTAEPAAKTLEPGGTTKIKIAVKDNNGKAVANSEVAVVAVDESVLALTNYKISNPLDTFYSEIGAGVTDYHSRENVLLANPEDVQIGVGNGNGIGDGIGGQASAMYSALMASRSMTAETVEVTSSGDKSQIKLRQNFDALAVFAPSVKTDSSGNATVKVKLPDNLTRYRVTAVAVTNFKQFGLGESSITAKQSLMIRPSAPRFMNFGDRIELPVVVQNQTDNPLTVDVAMRATNAILTGGNGRRVTVAANDRAEIRFPVSADRAGLARFQIGATAGKFADAAEIELSVYTPATTEAFATYGTTDQDGAIVQPIMAPNDVFPQFGGLEVTTSSTQLQELTDAFLYLQNYPFDCSEQIASRVLSVAALRDVLNAFDAEGLPPKSEIEAKMTADIKRLSELQHGDGGFSFWRSDDESIPFVSVHVAHALARAAAKGYVVPPELLRKAKEYLVDIESQYPKSYSQESRWAITAYALSVRDLMGDNDAAKARNLLQTATLEKLSLESVGWLLTVFADDGSSKAEIEILKRHLLNRATETAGAAHFVTNYTDGEYVLLSSDRRADGIILGGLLKVEPDNDLIPKIARGLLASKIKGHWGNTQENAFILLALDQYFQIYEKQIPNFVARVWFGDSYAGEQKFIGRTADSNQIRVPMSYLQQPQASSNLILDKQGKGRLYYRIGLNYAARNLNLDAADDGFAVTRKYEAVDDSSDVKQNADGSWTIKSGARVRVKVQMIAPTRRYHVALVDKLPAGFEIINPELAVSDILPNEKPDNAPRNRNYYGNQNWFEHQNLRDERAEAFTSLLWEGIWNYSYVARATTPGQFVAPPAKVEEMYQPETFGRSKTDFVTIE